MEKLSICYSECLMHIPGIFHWKLCNATQAYSKEFSRLWDIKYQYNFTLNFQELPDIGKFQIFQVYSDCEYSRENQIC